MLRYVLTVLAAAALGSLIATMVAAPILGGIGVPNGFGLVLGFTVASMPFTVPGVMMLIGFQAIAADIGLAGSRANLAMALLAIVAGFLALAVIGSWQLGLIGAGYGFTCALVLMIIERWRSRRSAAVN